MLPRRVCGGGGRRRRTVHCMDHGIISDIITSTTTTSTSTIILIKYTCRCHGDNWFGMIIEMS